MRRVQVQAYQFCWLIVVDNRDRRAQLDAIHHLSLAIDHLRLVVAKLVEQPFRMPMNLRYLQGETPVGSSATSNGCLRHIKRTGLHLYFQPPIASFEVKGARAACQEGAGERLIERLHTRWFGGGRTGSWFATCRWRWRLWIR